MRRLYGDPYVKKKRGIFEFILGGQQHLRLLEVRVFDDATKHSGSMTPEQYFRQAHRHLGQPLVHPLRALRFAELHSYHPMLSCITNLMIFWRLSLENGVETDINPYMTFEVVDARRGIFLFGFK